MFKIGVFGAGRLGKLHLNNWKEIEGVELVGFFDPDENTANEVAEKFQVKRFTNEDELISASDLVDVVAPTYLHCQLCEKAIRKSKHVFVEKPLANTMEEGRRLVKLANESGIKFQVGHLERFNPAFLAIKDLAIHPRYIEVERLDEYEAGKEEGSVILDLMIHDIDIILSLVKSEVKNIAATGVHVVSESADIANVRLEFHNGCVANLTSSRIAPEKKQSLRIFQKNASFHIDLLNKHTEIITPGERKTASVEKIDAIRRELEEFVDAIKNNTKTIVSEMDGLLAMDVAHQVLNKIGHNVTARA
jgi:predicted dehydrogenase